MHGTTSDLDLIRLAHDIRLPLHWIGYKDELKNEIPRNGNYIINLADSDDGTNGTHWTCVRLERGKAMYFDPFGCPPPTSVLDWVYRYIGPDHSKLVINTKDIQQINSNWCGQYCVACLVTMESHTGTIKKRLNDYISSYRIYH
jgi:hypothetical protein